MARTNPRLVHDILFRSAAGALNTIAADPTHLGANMGLAAVLHTWGQKLDHHRHVHCLVPAGGLSSDGQQRIPARPAFFLPVRMLSRVFRGNCLDMLSESVNDGRLQHHGGGRVLRRRQMRARRQECVVYAKPPFGCPVQVVRYLARYTRRVAIANRRILALADGKVTFRYKDYADANQVKTLTLPAVEFLRRFLTHVLPPGFIRIRHWLPRQPRPTSPPAAPPSTWRRMHRRLRPCNPTTSSPLTWPIPSPASAAPPATSAP